MSSLSEPTDTEGPAAPQRTHSIPGLHNFRDLGGYRTGDGRRVRWGTLFRSGVMDGLSAESRDALGRLGIRTVLDLRCNSERETKSFGCPADGAIDYHSRDYELSIGDTHQLLLADAAGEEAAVALLHRGYRKLPYEQAGSFTKLFELLAEGRTPLLFNCSAGKDRTGIAAALVLAVLGVPKETIEAEYALTDQCFDTVVAAFEKDPRNAKLTAMPRDRYLPLLRTHPTSLRATFEELEGRHGTVLGYVEEVLGVGTSEVEAMRAGLLEA